MLFSQQLKIRNLPRLLLIVLMLMALGALGHFWVQGEYNELKDFLTGGTVNGTETYCW